MVRVTGTGKFTKAVSKKLHVAEDEVEDEADSDKEKEEAKEEIVDDVKENADDAGGSDGDEEADDKDDENDDDDEYISDELVEHPIKCGEIQHTFLAEQESKGNHQQTDEHRNSACASNKKKSSIENKRNEGDVDNQSQHVKRH